MATERWAARDFQGFTPAVEARRSNEVYAVNGDNFVFDSIGPKSIFGDDLLQPQSVGDGRWAQGVRLKMRGGDRVFYFLPDGIFEWSENLGGLKQIYITPNTGDSPYRWTWGYLNEFVFFCHIRTGVLVFDPETDQCWKHNVAGLPAESIAICVDNGRLCVIDPIWFTWSAPSDGFNFVPTLGGAGQQRISDRVSGFPNMVTSYTQGVMVWTTGGVMRGEFTGDQHVYRFRALNTEYRLVNPFCSVKTDDSTCVILDERGLFQTRGEAPTTWTPLFNEFLIGYFKRLKLKIGQNVRIEWDELQRFLILSVSQSYQNPLYDYAFILYPPLDKWGIFRRPHYGIVPGLIQNSIREGDYYGYLDDEARIRLWRDSGSREVDCANPFANLWLSPIQPINIDSDDQQHTKMCSLWSPRSFLPDSYPRSGWYPADGLTPLPPTVEGLGASVRIGLLRFQNLQGSNDEMVEVTQVVIGSTLTGEPDPAREDWATTPPGTVDEDWTAESGGEDWGFEPTTYINHKTRVIGTIDGRTAFVEEDPSLVKIQKGARYFACSVTGIWHLIELSATEPGERFHLHSLELTATYAGKLM